MRQPAILLALGALILILLVALLRPDLSPAGLRDRLAGLETLRTHRPWSAAALFLLAYVAITALSLPLAVWMTLAAGALFGFWQGLVLSSFASAIGAMLAFLAARHLARDRVAARLGGRLRTVQARLDRDGAFYLFSLRLVAVVPFVAVNLLMGLTRMPALRFYWVSQLGMLPATAVYVNAGTQLARLDSLSGIVSAPVLASFAALAGLPWLARAGLRWWRRGGARG
ncbi:TVP38/TMEM64 family protein [Paracoccus spongiarum]|uniref:TVP38/TMEM64 family membrane protein n=1 Tax=Paracoccus spongiarum TaxID=3064387 RepID=A0ABT9JBR3_9RHOB|nr:TVP38/TMEM64 family protein [Paracoccus sp. 2205BS29-5]MDP5307114.1 TVP38/TMEM64 family protein [Paracoccus sp. 2205BS29-5]